MTAWTDRMPAVGDTASLAREVGPDDIELFTRISGDRNPLHYDPDAAGRSRFGEIVVQGGVTSAILNAVVAEELPGPGTVFLEVAWSFTAPVRPGDTITGEVEVSLRPRGQADHDAPHEGGPWRRRRRPRGHRRLLHDGGLMAAAHDDDVVLLGGARTPVGRMGGRRADVPATELGALAVRAALCRLGDPVVDSVVLGNVVQGGSGQNPARIAATAGGVPRTVPGITLNDVCLASMSGVVHAAHQLRAGEATRVLVGGFESMSRAQRSPVDLLVRDGLWCALEDVGMGELSDRENERLGIDRADQDAVALASHERAAAATDSGRLAVEILDGSGDEADEGIRRTTSAQRLAALAPAFGDQGTITAGNASQMSDAAAVGVLSTAGRARADGVEPLARVVGSAVIAGETSSLHERPAQAARVLLEREGLSASDIEVWEINEAFAGVVLASERALRIEHDRVNVNGGAIALGHPLGASGFRLVLTLAHELHARGGGLGVAAICGGGGQGRALLLEGL